MMYKLTFIDDNRTEHKLAEILIRIKKLNIIITSHTNPVEACKHLEALTAAEFPDVIIVDLNMPTMTGFEFVDYFGEKLAPTYPSTRVYLISGSIRQKDQELAISHPHITAFLEKPFTKEMLESIFIGPEGEV